MPKKATNPPLKKVVITTMDITELIPEAKPAHAHDLAALCLASPACQASTPCTSQMATWLVAADALGVNQGAQGKARATLAQLQADEPALVLAYDTDAVAYATTVQSISQGDVTIATNAGLKVRADPVAKPSDSAVPAKLRVSVVKKTGLPKAEWDLVPSAVLYVGQISLSPATDASWASLSGRGKSRHLPPLVAGQPYLVRVASIGKSGKQSAWSDTVSITGK